MSWEATTLTVIGVATGVISGTVAVVAWRHRTDRGPLPFLALTCTLGVWSLLYAVQLGFGTVEAQLP